MPKIDGRTVQIIGPGRDRKIVRPQYPLKNRIWPHTGPKRPGPGVSSSGATVGIDPVVPSAVLVYPFTSGYTEVDADEILSVTGDWSLRMYESAGVAYPPGNSILKLYRDYGSNYFGMDIRIRFKMTVAALPSGQNLATNYNYFTDVVPPTAPTDGTQYFSFGCWYNHNGTAGQGGLSFVSANGTTVSDDLWWNGMGTPGASCSWWNELTIDGDGNCVGNMYSDEYSTLVDTGTIAMKQWDYRFYYPYYTINGAIVDTNTPMDIVVTDYEFTEI